MLKWAATFAYLKVSDKNTINYLLQYSHFLRKGFTIGYFTITATNQRDFLLVWLPIKTRFSKKTEVKQKNDTTTKIEKKYF